MFGKLFSSSEPTDVLRTSALTAYPTVGRVAIPSLGEAYIIENQSSRERFLKRVRKINEKGEVQTAIGNLQRQLDLRHPNILRLVDFSVGVDKGLCSTTYLIYEFFEQPAESLRAVIRKGLATGGLSHTDLTHMLYQQVEAGCHLQLHGHFHGDITPDNLFYDFRTSQCKQIQTAEHLSNLKAIKAIKKKRIDALDTLYVSPTVFEALRKGQMDFPIDFQREDPFSLGMVILEAGLGESVQTVYPRKGMFDRAELGRLTEKFKLKFWEDNTLLATSVASLLVVEDSVRPTFVDIKEKLPNYEEVTAHLRQFTASNVLTNALVASQLQHTGPLNPVSQFQEP